MLQMIIERFANVHTGGLLFTADDAHHMKQRSWEILPSFGILGHGVRSMILLTVRSPWQRPNHAQTFMSSTSTRVIELEALDNQHLAALACQLLAVQMIPQRLDRVLRLNSMGVPSWVDLLLREYLFEGVIKVSAFL